MSNPAIIDHPLNPMLTPIFASVLDELDHGVAICGAAGATLYTNRTARAWAHACGLHLAAQGMPRAASAEETRHLLRLLRVACAGGPEGNIRLSGACGAAGLAARVTTLPLQGHPGTPTAPGLALITFRRLDAHDTAGPQRMMDMFGLTRAEAAILPALAAGATTGAVARGRGLSPHTVRTQVRAILTKTQSPNLRALTMLVASAMAR